MIKITFPRIGSVLAGITFYYSIVMIQTRILIPGNVQKAFTSNRIKRKIQGLSREQLNALIKVQDPNFCHHNGFEGTEIHISKKTSKYLPW